MTAKYKRGGEVLAAAKSENLSFIKNNLPCNISVDTFFTIHIIYYIIIKKYFQNKDIFDMTAPTSRSPCLPPALIWSCKDECHRCTEKKNPSKKNCNFKKNISCNIASVLLICKILFILPRSRRH